LSTSLVPFSTVVAPIQTKAAQHLMSSLNANRTKDSG
jgi:hypothetical protein